MSMELNMVKKNGIMKTVKEQRILILLMEKKMGSLSKDMKMVIKNQRKYTKMIN